MLDIKCSALQWSYGYAISKDDDVLPQRHARNGFEAGAKWMQGAFEVRVNKNSPTREMEMLEPLRPDPGRLRMALSCAGTFDEPVAKIIAEELRWQEWAVNKWRGRSDYRWPDDLGWDGVADCLQQLKLHIQTISRQAGKLERYRDSIEACLIAAGTSEDTDIMEAQVNEAGTKPSHFIAQQMNKLRESNTAMVRQLRDQDLRAERQHREWDARMRDLQDKFDVLQGQKEDSDGNVTSLKVKFERIGEALQSLDGLMKK